MSGFLAEHGCNIIDSAQFGDSESQLFFMRVHFALEDGGVSDELLRADFALLAATMQLDWELRDARYKPRVMQERVRMYSGLVMAVTVNFNNNKRITRPVLSHGAAIAVKLRPPPLSRGIKHRVDRVANDVELSSTLQL